MLAAIFSRELLQEIVSRRRRSKAELNGVDACPWVELAYQAQLVGSDLRLAGIREQKNHVWPHLQCGPESLNMVGCAVGENAADEVRRQPLARLIGKRHRRRAAAKIGHDVRVIV